MDWRPVSRATGGGPIGKGPFLSELPARAAGPGGWRTNHRSDSTRVIRPLDPLDVVRSAVFGQRGMRNRAFTLGGLPGRRAPGLSLLGLSKKHLSPRAKDCAWVWCMGNRVLGVASVRPRAGRRSWEVSALYIGSTARLPVSELLEQAATSAAGAGAERVFLRLREDDEVISAARVGGFFPCTSETLYQGRSSGTNKGNGRLFDARMRPMEPGDDYVLFRLYNAATPAPVRSLVAMTFDQWQASREQSPGRHDQRVFEREDNVRAWLDTSLGSGFGSLSAVVHPDDNMVLPEIVNLGLRALSSANTIWCLVPEYQAALGHLLEARGFEPVEHFITLVKTSAKTSRYTDAVRSALASTESR